MRDSARASTTIASMALGVAGPLALLVWNGFPFAYWDTSEYLFRWVEARPGLDRPLFYSLWLGAFHPLPHGLHVLAVVQAVLAVALLAAVGGRALGRWDARTTILMLGFAASPSAVHAVALMPDVGTLYLGLLLAWLAIAESIPELTVVGVGVAGFSLWHFSNVAIVVATLPAVVLARRLTRRRLDHFFACLGGCAVVVVAGLVWNSHRAGAGARLQTASTFFLAARLQESGVLAAAARDVWLESASENNRSAIEARIEALAEGDRRPEWFLWEASPLNREWPGWRDDPKVFARAEAAWAPVVRRGLTSSPGSFAKSGMANVAAMIDGTGYLAGFVPHDDESGVARVLRRHWSDEYAAFSSSRQRLGQRVDVAFPRLVSAWRRLQWPLVIAVALAVVVGGGVLARSSPPAASVRALAVAIVLAAFVLSNAVVCGVLSSAASRYAERVVALAVIAPLMVIFAWAERKHAPMPSTRA